MPLKRQQMLLLQSLVVVVDAAAVVIIVVVLLVAGSSNVDVGINTICGERIMCKNKFPQRADGLEF